MLGDMSDPRQLTHPGDVVKWAALTGPIGDEVRRWTEETLGIDQSVWTRRKVDQ